MATGIVKWFNAIRKASGSSNLTPAASDVFVHIIFGKRSDD